MTSEGPLKRNCFQRFEVGDVEIKSGAIVEIEINKVWLLGIIEHWHESVFWFSKLEGIAVILRNGINARILNEA